MRLRRYEIWGPPWYYAEAGPAYLNRPGAIRQRRARAFTLRGARRHARRLDRRENHPAGTFNVIGIPRGSSPVLGVSPRGGDTQ